MCYRYNDKNVCVQACRALQLGLVCPRLQYIGSCIANPPSNLQSSAFFPLFLFRNSRYGYSIHSYIGPAWINVTMYIPYLSDAPGSWKTLKFTPFFQRSQLACGGCTLSGCPAACWIQELDHLMLCIFWINAKRSLIERGMVVMSGSPSCSICIHSQNVKHFRVVPVARIWPPLLTIWQDNRSTWDPKASRDHWSSDIYFSDFQQDWPCMVYT